MNRSLSIGSVLGSSLCAVLTACGGASSSDLVLGGEGQDAAIDATAQAPDAERSADATPEARPADAGVEASDARGDAGASEGGVDAASDPGRVRCWPRDSSNPPCTGEPCCSDGIAKACIDDSRTQQVELERACSYLQIRCDENADCGENFLCCGGLIVRPSSASKVFTNCLFGTQCRPVLGATETFIPCKRDSDCDGSTCVEQQCNGVPVRTCGALPASAGCTR
jgi:hypothetical protein